MNRKRMVKTLMGIGIHRNMANTLASACGPDMPHDALAAIIFHDDGLRDFFELVWPAMKRGGCKIELCVGEEVQHLCRY